MAQTVIFNNTDTVCDAAFISGIGATLLFADSTIVEAPESDGPNRIKVTSRFAAGDAATSDVTLLADDAETELQFEQSTGKFVDGNLIAGFAPLTEIKNDVRNYIFYPTVADSTEGVFTGICNSTQSQDYTPALVANSRPILMISPAQALTLTK
jgi:hypothetical protein